MVSFNENTGIRKFALDKYGVRYYNDIVAGTERRTVVLVGTFIIVLLSVLVNTNEGKEQKIVNLSKFSDFGLRVKMQLLQIGKEQKWLEGAISEKTGLYVDSGYLYKILTGQRNAPKIVAAICEILNISEDGE